MGIGRLRAGAPASGFRRGGISGAEVIARQKPVKKQAVNQEPNQQSEQTRSENPRAISAAVRNAVFQRETTLRVSQPDEIQAGEWDEGLTV